MENSITEPVFNLLGDPQPLMTELTSSNMWLCCQGPAWQPHWVFSATASVSRKRARFRLSCQSKIVYAQVSQPGARNSHPYWKYTKCFLHPGHVQDIIISQSISSIFNWKNHAEFILWNGNTGRGSMQLQEKQYLETTAGKDSIWHCWDDIWQQCHGSGNHLEMPTSLITGTKVVWNPLITTMVTQLITSVKPWPVMHIHAIEGHCAYQCWCWEVISCNSASTASASLQHVTWPPTYGPNEQINNTCLLCN